MSNPDPGVTVSYTEKVTESTAAAVSAVPEGVEPSGLDRASCVLYPGFDAPKALLTTAPFESARRIPT